MCNVVFCVISSSCKQQSVNCQMMYALYGHVKHGDDDCGQKRAGDTVSRKKETGKTKEEVFRCGEGGHAG